MGYSHLPVEHLGTWLAGLWLGPLARDTVLFLHTKTLPLLRIALHLAKASMAGLASQGRSPGLRTGMPPLSSSREAEVRAGGNPLKQELRSVLHLGCQGLGSLLGALLILPISLLSCFTNCQGLALEPRLTENSLAPALVSPGAVLTCVLHTQLHIVCLGKEKWEAGGRGRERSQRQL